MKKREYIKLLACWIVLMMLHIQPIHAQRISHNFHNTSMSEALATLAKSTKDYRINFMYNELEDFTVTTQVVKRTAPEAIQQIMGFYPMKMTIDGKNIFVECTQKAPTKMMGRVIDAQHHAVEFANVSLLSVQDSSFITGGVTNENGQFVIPCEVRKAIVKVSCIGYQTIARTFDTGKIGNIALKEATMNLQKVVVKAVRPRTKLTEGGFKTQVQGTLLSDVGMATDLLKQIPRVRMDGDGELKVFGKGTPEIYLNGRKVTDSKELEHLSSKDIKTVDVITNPGAQYNAEVSSIIRINTIKQQGVGLSGSLYSKYLFADKNNWMENMSLNYRIGGLDIFSVWAWNDTYRKFMSPTSDMTILGNQHRVDIAMPYQGKLRMHNPYGKWGMNYQIDDNHSLGMFYSVYNYTHSYFNLLSDYSVKEDGKDMGLVKYNNDESSSRIGPMHEANVYYEGKMGKWNLNVNGTAVWNASKTYQDAIETSEQLESRQINSVTNYKRRMLAGKIDLGYSLSDKTMLSFGSEYTNSHTRNIYHNEQSYISASDSKIEEQNIAAFASLDMQVGKNVGVQAGVRYEHVSHDYYENDNETGVLGKNEDMSRTYDNFFPVFSLSYQQGKFQSEWSLSMKTQRPSYVSLSGYTRYDNRYTYEGGNPSLLPTNIYNVGWDVQYDWLGFSANYGYTKDAIAFFYVLYDTSSDIILTRPDNINHKQMLDMSLVATPVIGFWHPVFELDYQQQFLDGKKYGYLSNLHKPQFSIQFNNRFAFNHDWSASVDYFMATSYSTDFSEQGSSKTLNLSLRKLFLKKALTIQLEANDIFHGMNSDRKVFAPCMTMIQKTKRNTRSFAVTASYNFNSTRSKYKGTGAGNEEKNR